MNYASNTWEYTRCPLLAARSSSQHQQSRLKLKDQSVSTCAPQPPPQQVQPCLRPSASSCPSSSCRAPPPRWSSVTTATRRWRCTCSRSTPPTRMSHTCTASAAPSSVSPALNWKCLHAAAHCLFLCMEFEQNSFFLVHSPVSRSN